MNATVAQDDLKSNNQYFLKSQCFQQIKNIFESVLNLKTPAKKYLPDTKKFQTKSLTDLYYKVETITCVTMQF